MIERNTAFKTRIKDVVDGKSIFRARIFGSAVSKYISEDRTFASITLDDCSETIRIKVFKEDVSLIEEVEPGDIVDVVGKIDKYEGERYIRAESIKVVDDPNWELVWDLELILKGEKRLEREQKELPEEETKGDISKAAVLNLIAESDKGEGVKYVKLLEESKLDDEKLEEILNGLMGDGEIYEPKIGRFKRV